MRMSEQADCVIIRPNEQHGFAGKQGLNYFAGIAAETAGSQALCMHMLRMPAGARAKAHHHESHETAIYMLSGTVEMYYGHQLERHAVVHAGEYVYIPAGMPHFPFNPYAEEAVAIIARTDPNEQESVVLRPDLDGLRM
ncbi:cupin domain-containing protein [Herpetosiphon llansteffanensis]